MWVALALGLGMALIWLTPAPEICSWDFHNNLWGPANLLLHGQAPYSLQPPYGPYLAVWMPQVIGAFLYLGLLPCWPAAKLWWGLALLAMLAIIWYCGGRKLPRPALFGLCLLLIFLYPPIYVHFVIGQFSFLFVLLMLLVVFEPRARPFIPLLLAVGLAKPQLGVFVYPGLLLAEYRQGGVRGAARLALSTGAVLALLILPLFVGYPGWVSEFIQVEQANMAKQWAMPTLYVYLGIRLGGAGQALWAVLFAGGLAASLWLWLRRDRREAMLWSLALTPMLTTYAFSWDFTLLLPLLIWLLLARLKSRVAQAALVAGAGLVDVLLVALRWRHDIPDISQWWAPPALLLVFFLALGVERARAHFMAQPAQRSLGANDGAPS